MNPNQKYFLFGLIEQKVIPGTRILCSGFWGTARHLNYLGEIIQSIAISLPCVLVAQSNFYRYMPLLYPLYYILLFITRQIDDDKVCRIKYGDIVWNKYCALVPYRIFPPFW
jgi:protein-S-isoprenylcysteine O-methyltransferase Ste14